MPALTTSPAHRLTRRRMLALATAVSATAAVAPGLTFGHQSASTPEVERSPVAMSLDADASSLLQRVADAVVTAMQQHLVPGAAVGVIVGDREEHAVFGIASTSSLRPVTPETRFQIGSVTKTVTGTGIWRLIDEGSLDLDAPLRTYLPDLTLMDAEAAELVTVANLLDHSGGWYGDEGFDTGSSDDALARYVADRVPELPQVFSPGQFFSYNNAGFSMLGRLIEVSTGTDYRTAIRQLVIDPLGMDDSTLDHDEVRARPYADGHQALVVNGQLTLAVATPLWLPRSVDSAGGIWSTTRNLVRYARFHMANGVVPGPANILGPEALALMREPVIDVPGATTLQMGRDWFVQDLDGVRVASHGGDTVGQHADLVMIPEYGFAMTVLTNSQGGGAAVAAAALDAALAEIPELASLVGRVGLGPEMSVAPDTAPVDVAPERLTEYVGRFADPGQSLTFTATNDGLSVLLETLVQPGAFTVDLNPAPLPELPVSFVADDIAALGQARIPFVRDADGTVRWVSMGLRLLPRVDD